jgi:hypothetical protein
LGIHRVLNLHGQRPVEVGYLSNTTGEVPYLTPWFFPADIAGWAVLHALAICGREAEQWVPRYTVFSLTYFSADPQEVRRRQYAGEARRGAGDPEFYPGMLYPPGTHTQVDYDESLYDLPAWAQRGQLGYMDISNPQLPLRMGPGTALPAMYQHIAGDRRTYVWRKGQRQPF